MQNWFEKIYWKLIIIRNSSSSSSSSINVILQKVLFNLLYIYLFIVCVKRKCESIAEFIFSLCFCFQRKANISWRCWFQATPQAPLLARVVRLLSSYRKRQGPPSSCPNPKTSTRVSLLIPESFEWNPRQPPLVYCTTIQTLNSTHFKAPGLCYSLINPWY